MNPVRRPQVDVGVVTWNTRDLTVAALRRLLDSDQGCDIRLLVRDNGSTDGTADAIAAQVPEAELDAGRENLGFAAGVNLLLGRSEAPWFVTLNSDAWPQPMALGRLVAAALEHPRAAAVAARLERPDGTLEYSAYQLPSLKVAALLAFGSQKRQGRLGDAMMLEGYWRHDRPRAVGWAVGACLLLARRAVEEVGPLDDTFFMYAEDVEWCWRAGLQGWEIWFEPSAVVCHVGNASGEARYGQARTAAWMRNTYSVYRRHHSRLETAAYRTVNALGCARKAAEARWRGDRPAELRWRRDALLNLRDEA
jgi:N-acetylglucosaminyl-diphospho-decaprenol L-rhamnosyltransferase